ncbi:MAG: hypothetical protein ABIQ04_04595 [Candidatus Saccharimonadales bacterium]
MILINTAEGGTDGTTITTANSGGDSGQPWNNVTGGGATTMTYSSLTSAHGSLSYHITTGSTGSNAYMYWSTAVSQPGKTMYMQSYWYFSTTPVNTPFIFEYTNASIQTIGGFGIGGNKLIVKDSSGTTVSTSSTSIPLGQWFRTEMMLFSNVSAGQIVLKIYLTKDGKTPTETITTPATINTRGDDINAGIWGNVASTANIDYYLDDMSLQDIGYIGPNPYISKYHQNTAEGQPNSTGLTRANSGGGSGTAFDIVSLNGSASVIYSNFPTMHGNRSYYSFCSTSTDWFVLAFNNQVNDMTGAYRFYVYLNSMSSATTDIAYTRSATSSVAKVQIGNTGILSVCDSTGAAIKAFSTTPLTTATWYRIEQQCTVGTSTTNGTINTQYFLGDSLTPLDSYSVSNVNTGTTPIIDCRFGKISSTQGTMNAYWDDIAFTSGNMYPIGPASVQATTSWVSGP